MRKFYEDVPQSRGCVDMDYLASGTIDDLCFEKDFLLILEIGKGSVATVYKVLNRVEGCLYAMKKMSCDPCGDRLSNCQAII